MALDKIFALRKDRRMQIKDFVSKFGRDELATIAAEAGTTLGYLTDQVANGHRKPSPELAKKIAVASRGRLKLSDLRPDLWGKTA